MQTAMTLPQALDLGWKSFHQGRLQDALSIFQQILQANPNVGEAWNGLGYVFFQNNQRHEAAHCFRQAIQQQPNVAAYHYALGTTLHHLEQCDEAARAYERTLELDPTETRVFSNLGAIFTEQGRFEEAERLFERALAARPDNAMAYVNLGNLRKRQKRHDDAIDAYQTAIRLNPIFHLPYYNLGTLHLDDRKNFDEAQAWLMKAHELHPNGALIMHNIGLTYQVQGNARAAESWYRRALERNPQLFESCKNLGLIAFEREELRLAEKHLHQAAALRPGDAETQNYLGGVYQKTKELDKSLHHFQAALRLKDNYIDALNNLLQLKQYLCDWSDMDALVAQQRRALHEDPEARISPFSILSIESTAEEQLRAAEQWVRIVHAPMRRLRDKLAFPVRREPRSRLKVGYLSGDFFNHAVAYLMGELFELHDRAGFECFAYSYGPDDKSDVRRRLMTTCDHFRELRDASAEEVARAIHDDGVDILVDLKGHTGYDRTSIMTLRPAPIQVEWLGYPGTMGGDAFDYVIADDFIVTPEAEPYFSEKVVRMPGCYQINDRKRTIHERTPSRAECGLPEQGFVFCDFNRPFKFTPTLLDQWTMFLREIPGSVLWLLFETPWAEQNLRREAAARGVDPQRLIFAPHRALPEHLARYRLADLCLDTYPYTSHTTASDALWAGCPLVTRVGPTFVTRVAGSILRAAGLPELITYSIADHDALVLDLARHPDKLRAIRAKLAAQRDTCALFDSPRFTRELEWAYRKMWSLHESGQGPQAFHVRAHG
jgi:predicted O-linked N-acetylglucosamine transferase (SPINDLY family)